MTAPAVTIAGEGLSVTVNPRVGGTITSIIHRPSGLSVLGSVPWPVVDEPIASLAARDEAEWLTRYGGGWPLIFPNGGDACVVDGVFHGFHGEASIAPWTASATATSIALTRRFTCVPVEMRRHLHVEDDMLVMREHLRMLGDDPIDVMWGHHPTLGSDLLAGPVEITTSARMMTIDQTYDPSNNPLRPGATSRWPIAVGKEAPVDLSHPCDPMASLVYLHDFDDAWIAVRRIDNAVAVRLSWDARHFPCTWLWCELAGTLDPPWRGRTRLIGIEPNTTWPGTGLMKAKAAGGALIRLHPGQELETSLYFKVFSPLLPGMVRPG